METYDEQDEINCGTSQWCAYIVTLLSSCCDCEPRLQPSQRLFYQASAAMLLTAIAHKIRRSIYTSPMLTHDRYALRQQFFAAWQKYQTPGALLTPLEQMLGALIAAHPEYHGLFAADADERLAQDFDETAAANPFLHLGLHIALQEQVQSDRPAGIRALFQQGVQRGTEPLALEHRLMECLQQALWQAQSSGQAPNEQQYLDCVRRIIEG